MVVVMERMKQPPEFATINPAVLQALLPDIAVTVNYERPGGLIGNQCALSLPEEGVHAL